MALTTVEIIARVKRRDVLADGEVQIVHFANRCVRREVMCQIDPVTVESHEHQRDLIRRGLEFLASVMGLEVLG